MFAWINIQSASKIVDTILKNDFFTNFLTLLRIYVKNFTSLPSPIKCCSNCKEVCIG